MSQDVLHKTRRTARLFRLRYMAQEVALASSQVHPIDCEALGVEFPDGVVMLWHNLDGDEFLLDNRTPPAYRLIGFASLEGMKRDYLAYSPLIIFEDGGIYRNGEETTIAPGD